MHKLYDTHFHLDLQKSKVEVLAEIEQNKIRNNINNLKSDSLQYVKEVEILNNKFLELPLHI